MTQIRYYTDEHVSRAVIKGLRQRGIDVLTVPEAEMLSATDESHFEFAWRERRVIFTLDDDFLRLASKRTEHSGVVYARQGRVSTGDMIRGLVLIYQVLDAEEMVGQIEFL